MAERTSVSQCRPRASRSRMARSASLAGGVAVWRRRRRLSDADSVEVGPADYINPALEIRLIPSRLLPFGGRVSQTGLHALVDAEWNGLSKCSRRMWLV